MAEDFISTGADVTQAFLYDHTRTSMWDFTHKIVKFEISQSMDSLRYSGTLFCYDTEGLLETIPLRGEEYMEMKLVGYDLKTEINVKAQVYKITNIIPSEGNNGAAYTLHFMSKESWDSNKRVVTAYYQRDAFRLAKDIFNKYIAKTSSDPEISHPKDESKNRKLPFNTERYKLIENKDREIYIQPSSNSIRVTIPRLTPLSAIYFVGTKSFSVDSPSCTYRFFETLENYYFVTDEFFIKDARKDEVINLFYAPTASNMPGNPIEQTNRIEDLQILSPGVDAISDINSGGYRNKITEVDLIRKKVNLKEPLLFNYDNAKYIDMYGDTKRISDNQHSPLFRNETFTKENAKSFLVFKDYTGNGDLPSDLQNDRFLPQIISNRISYQHHLNSVVISAKLKGRLDIRPGMIVNLDIKTLAGSGDNQQINPIFGGRYLIKSTNHLRETDSVLYTTLTLVKFDWSKGTTVEDETYV